MTRSICILALTAALSIVGSRTTAEDTFRYEDIVRQIETLKTRSVEGLLPSLPPEVRSNFVLMTQSKSNHLASTYSPRVILCSPTARLMMAYSTAKDDEQRHVLEVIQWRDDTDRFEFREIAFDPAGREAPKFSEANPSRCTACHGESLRPNWEPARRWPGALGQGTIWEDHEAQRFQILAKRTEPRLSALEWRTKGPSSETPSARMARLTNVLNMRRFARFLRESPDYEHYKFAIVAGLMGAPEFLSVEPIRALNKERPKDHHDRLMETRRLVGTVPPTFVSGGWNSFRSISPVDSEAIASLRTVFEPRGISLRDMSTSFRNPILLTGEARTDFGEVLLMLYSLDGELRRAAPLPDGGVNALLEPGGNRDAWTKRLMKAAEAKDSWRRRLALQSSQR